MKKSFIHRLLHHNSGLDVEQISIDLPSIIKELHEESHAESLLTEYKETIETLRNWDRLIFQMLTILGTVVAGVITFIQKSFPMFWGAVISLVLFWVFTYIYLAKLAEARIDVLIQIERELGMVGHYRKLREVKQARTLVVWFVLPFLGAFLIGPLIGIIFTNPNYYNSILYSIINFLISLFVNIKSLFHL